MIELLFPGWLAGILLAIAAGTRFVRRLATDVLLR